MMEVTAHHEEAVQGGGEGQDEALATEALFDDGMDLSNDVPAVDTPVIDTPAPTVDAPPVPAVDAPRAPPGDPLGAPSGASSGASGARRACIWRVKPRSSLKRMDSQPEVSVRAALPSARA